MAKGFSASTRNSTRPASESSCKRVLHLFKMLFDTYKTGTPSMLLLYDKLITWEAN